MANLKKNLKGKSFDSVKEYFNNERFLAAVDAYKSKLIPIYKELSKAAIKWFAVGIATGAAVGFMLNKIANKE